MANETWNKIKNFLSKEQLDKPKTKKKVTTNKSAKDIATEKGEPYVEVITLEIDPKNPIQGAFELEWNDLFIEKLRAQGYTGGKDEDIIDTWFQQVCRNIAIEEWEAVHDTATNQFVIRTNIVDGKSEIK